MTSASLADLAIPTADSGVAAVIDGLADALQTVKPDSGSEGQYTTARSVRSELRNGGRISERVDKGDSEGSLATPVGQDGVNDVYVGTAGPDIYDGKSGDDTISGVGGADTLTGGAGNDVFAYEKYSDSSQISGKVDTIVNFATGSDRVRLSLAGNQVDASTFRVVEWYNLGQSTLDKSGVVGDGFYSINDKTLYIYNGTSENIALDGGYAIASAGVIEGSDLQFIIAGTAGADTLMGGLGSDTITGGAGNDTILHSAGADSLDGGEGDDKFVYTARSDLFPAEYSIELVDSISGGPGTDQIVLGGRNLAWDITIINSWSTKISGVEEIVVAGPNTVGTDVTLSDEAYEAGLRKIDFSADTSTALRWSLINVSAESGMGNGYVLTGSSGFDDIRGGAGNDVITGGYYQDALDGGAGLDIYRYFAVSEGHQYERVSFESIDVLQFLASGFGLIGARPEFQYGKSFAEIGRNGNILVAGTNYRYDLETAAAQISENHAITTTNGFFIFTDPTGKKNLVYSTDLAGNGTETILLQLMGVELSDLSATNFSFLGDMGP